MKHSTVLPILTRDAEIIDIKEACFHSGRSDKSIRRWCKEDGIGWRLGVSPQTVNTWRKKKAVGQVAQK